MGQAVDQRVDDAQVPGLHQSPVEDQRRHRRTRPPFIAHGIQVRVLEARPIEPGADQRPGFPPFGLVTDEAGGEKEEIARVLGSAVNAVLPQPVVGLRTQRRQPRQFGVRLIVAGQKGNRDAVLAAHSGDLVGAVGPIAAPAQKPDDDDFRLGDDRVHVEIDGHVVAEMQEAGQAQTREIVCQTGARLRQRRELGIGRRQHDDVARRLAQVDRLGAVGNTPGLGGQQMHSFLP